MLAQDDPLTDPEAIIDAIPINGLALTVNSPISASRLGRVVAELAAAAPTDILDVGCGWAELLLRVLAATPGATGTGVDNESIDIERGRVSAADRGLGDRVKLITDDAKTITGRYDLVLCLGAHLALDEDPARALQALRALTTDGGRLLFGIDYWLRTPPPDRLATMWGGADLQDSCWLPDLVDAAAAAGWRLLDLQEATQQEWDDYECGLVRNQEEWLLAHPDHPGADDLRRRLDQSRSAWLRGHHGYLGFGWLTLAAMPGS